MTETGAMVRRGDGTMLGAPDPKILHRVEGVVEVTRPGFPAGQRARRALAPGIAPP